MSTSLRDIRQLREEILQDVIQKVEAKAQMAEKALINAMRHRGKLEHLKRLQELLEELGLETPSLEKIVKEHGHRMNPRMYGMVKALVHRLERVVKMAERLGLKPETVEKLKEKVSSIIRNLVIHA